MMKRKLIRCLPVVLLIWALLTTGASATLQGYLKIRVENLNDVPQKGFTVNAICVADAEGVLVPEFAGAGISPEAILDTTANAANARALYTYVSAHDIKGIETITDDNGEVQYINMGRSVYLVWASERNELTFAPFLVYMPTYIDGVEIWGVESEPKAGSKPNPTPPPQVTPTPPPPPSIPQTGINKLPMHLLLVLGVMSVAFGVSLLVIEKGRRRDE